MKCAPVLILGLTLLLSSPFPAVSGGTKLRYKFIPGDQWECVHLSRTNMTVMGQKEDKTQRHTILYTVSRGKKKGWAHLSARYLKPSGAVNEAQQSMGLYDFIFEAEVHPSGDTRNITVSGVEDIPPEPSMDPMVRTSMIQAREMMAQAMEPAVFWFPELPEEALLPGDEFEDRRKDGVKNPNMASQYMTRQIFELDEVSEGLAYFSTQSRSASKTSAAGMDMKGTMAGKGETIFDLEEGMWIEVTTKTKMNFSGMMMGTGGGNMSQEMFMVDKRTLQRR